MRARAPWLLMMLALLVLLILPGAALAAEDSPEREPIDLKKLDMGREAKRATHPLRNRISRYMAAAHKASEEGSPEDGLALLDKLNPKRLNPYERALVSRVRGFVAYKAGEDESAIENFRKALREETLPVKDEADLRFAIAQLLGALMRWREAISMLHEWFRYIEDPDPMAYYLLGFAHYQLKEIDTAIGYTETAVDLSPEPKEGWLGLLATLYVQKQDYQSAVPVLEELVVRFPKREYWVQLLLTYGAREDYRSSLSVQQLAYLQGLLPEDKELRRLARGYRYHNLPYPAAQVLEKGLQEGTIEPDAEAFKLLANSWLAAREYERSLEPMQKAAELSQGGELYLRLGRLYMQRQEWNHSSEMIQKAIEKGDFDNQSQAHLLLGICYYNGGKVEEALCSFARARRYEPTRVQADQWIEYIEKETEERLTPAEQGRDGSPLPPVRKGAPIQANPARFGPQAVLPGTNAN